MGEAKAGLEWHGTTLLHRTVAVVGEAVAGPVVVVRAPGQELPPLPAGVEAVEDPVADLGPLQGLATGLAVVGDRAEIAFVCATDLPFLRAAFIRRVVSFDGFDVVLPVVKGVRQPLAAAYRTALAGQVAGLLADGIRRLGAVAERVSVLALTEADLLADPELARDDANLDSVVNVNTPEEYAAARARS
jgi:molybdenum cofactor guanylyltransferase